MPNPRNVSRGVNIAGVSRPNAPRWFGTTARQYAASRERMQAMSTQRVWDDHTVDLEFGISEGSQYRLRDYQGGTGRWIRVGDATKAAAQAQVGWMTRRLEQKIIEQLHIYTNTGFTETQVRAEVTGFDAVITVGGGGPFLESGTVAHPIFGNPILRFSGTNGFGNNDGVVFTPYVWHPGTAAHPILERAMMNFGGEGGFAMALRRVAADAYIAMKPSEFERTFF